MGKIRVITNLPSLIVKVYLKHFNHIEKQGHSSPIPYFNSEHNGNNPKEFVETIEIDVDPGIYQVRLYLPYFSEMSGKMFPMPVLMDKLYAVTKDDSIVDIEFKAKLTNDDSDIITETHEERLFDQRSFNYYFLEGEEVEFDINLRKYFDRNSFGINYEKYIGKTGVAKKCRSDLHAFGRGSFYLQNFDFDGEILKDVMPGLLIKKKDK